MVNGYNVEEVDEFLDLLTVDYEKVYKEMSDAKGKVDELNESLEHYRSIENTLQSTLMMAQSTACLLYTSPSPRDPKTSRMPSSA